MTDRVRQALEVARKNMISHEWLDVIAAAETIRREMKRFGSAPFSYAEYEALDKALEAWATAILGDDEERGTE